METSFMESSSSLPTTEKSSAALSARCMIRHIGGTDTELGGLDDSLDWRLSVSTRLDELQERLDKFEERIGALEVASVEDDVRLASMAVTTDIAKKVQILEEQLTRGKKKKERREAQLQERMEHFNHRLAGIDDTDEGAGQRGQNGGSCQVRASSLPLRVQFGRL